MQKRSLIKLLQKSTSAIFDIIYNGPRNFRNMLCIYLTKFKNNQKLTNELTRAWHCINKHLLVYYN